MRINGPTLQTRSQAPPASEVSTVAAPTAKTAPDPKLFIPQNLSVNPGSTVTVPLQMLVTEQSGILVSEVDAAIAYDTSKFTVSNARLGSMLSPSTFDVTYFDTTSFPGEIFLSAASSISQQGFSNGAEGAVFLVDFTAKATAGSGPSAVNLQAQFNEGGGLVQPTDVLDNNFNPLTLTPAPTNASNDPVDGIVTVNGPTKTATSTSLSAAPNPSTYGQSVTLTAVVTGSGGTPTGTVNFMDGSQILGSATLVNGTASLSTANMSAGSLSLTAVYGGDSNFTGSTSTALSQTVNKARTTTVASNASATFASASQPVTLNATVASNGVGVSEGTVTFTVFDVNNDQVGASVTSGTVNAGNASAVFTLPAGQSAGTYSIQAVYNPGPDYQGSSDSSPHLIVGPVGTTLIAAPEMAPFSTMNQSVTLSAQVLLPGNVGVNEGTVTFSILAAANQQIGTSVTSDTLVNGNASAVYTLPAGTSVNTYTILAVYNPGPDFQTSRDSFHQLTVTPASTNTAAANITTNFATTDQVLTLSATVTSNDVGVNEGTVLFTVLSGNVQIGAAVTSGTVSGGKADASFVLPANTAAGTYTIQAAYSGSADFLAGTPATGMLEVDGPPTLPPINGTNTITAARNQFPMTIALHANSPVGNPLSYSTQLLGDSLLFDLQQRYQFTIIGTAYYGAPGLVLHSNQPGPGSGGYYLLRPSDGALYAYDGSGSYAHSYTVSAILLATLGSNVYTDPYLLVNAQAPVDYTLLYDLQQQNQFQGVGYADFGAAAYVLKAATNNSFGNPYYLVRSSDGALYAYDGSGSYAHSFANGSPVQIDGTAAILGVSVYANPTLLTGVGATPTLYAQLNQLQQQYDLQELNGSFYTNTDGHQAQWVYSPVVNQFGQHWYTLTLQSINGQQRSVLTAWQGYPDSEVGAVLATLDPSVYSHLGWLTNATAPPDPAPGTATVDASGNLVLNLPSSSFVGTFKVQVTVTDGFLSARQTATVTVTDAAPTLSVQQGATTIVPGSTQSVPHGGLPVSYTLNSTGSNGQSVTTTTAVASYNQLFALEQQYRFIGLGTVTAGATAYALQATGNNAFGNPYYLLRPGDGALFAYDGSGSYAHTFANTTPLATLGAIVAADPTLLTNASAPVDYTTLFTLQQHYQFTAVGAITAGAPAYVLHSNQSGPGVSGYYLIAPNGGLYAYDGSGSYAHTFANSANLLATLDPSVYVNPLLLMGATTAPGLYMQLQAVEQTDDLHFVAEAVAGAPADVFMAPINNANGNPYYLLNPSGGLYAYDGSGSYAHTFANSANQVASLDAIVFSNPAMLTNAKAPLAASVGGMPVTVTQPVGTPATFSINAPMGFVGTVQVTVTSTDGALSTTQTFQVAVTDTAPAPAAIAPQSISLAQPSQTLTLSATDAENDPVSYTASVAGFSAAYNLQQQYRFQGLGYFSTPDRETAYVLSAAGTNGNGNSYYLLTSTGGLYAYDGSGSYGHTIANSANRIAQLSSNVYNQPTLLTSAQPPVAPPAQLQVVGNQLTVNVTGLPIGTIFEVLVTASDGAETTTTGFVVTVTA